MEHSVWYLAGFLFGLAVVAIIGIVWLIKRRGACEYDERQELARGKAFQAAFFVLFGYLVITGILDLVWGIRFGDSFTSSFVGICIAIVVFACSCIAHDAYFSIHDKPRNMILIFVLLTVVNGLIGIINLLKYGFMPNGILTTDSMNLICAVMSLCILVAILLKLRHDRAEERAV